MCTHKKDKQERQAFSFLIQQGVGGGVGAAGIRGGCFRSGDRNREGAHEGAAGRIQEEGGPGRILSVPKPRLGADGATQRPPSPLGAGRVLDW